MAAFVRKPSGAEAKRCEMQMARWLGKAMESDSNDRRVNPRPSVSWMVNR
jgi:hypothetical protein